MSRWGWKQNSLVTVDTATRKFTFNHEFYLLKHLSHYVEPGAQLLTIKGRFDDLLAFKNRDNSIVIVVQNDGDTDKTLHIKVGEKMIEPTLKADSFNTLVIR